MSAPELKPCPLCGGPLIERHAGWFDHPKGKCVLSGRAFHKGFIGQWNTRATDPALTAIQPDTERAEPVAWRYWHWPPHGHETECRWVYDDDGNSAGFLEPGALIEPLYTTPQPAPAPQAREITVQEAARVLLGSHTVQTMTAAGKALDLEKTLRALAAMQKGG